MSVARVSQLPQDAVVLTESEATTYIWEVIGAWESIIDTWALRYAPGVLGAINAVSGVLVNNHYRRRLKLKNFGYLSSVIPISVMPGVLTALFHRHTVSTAMLLRKQEACPICYEMRSGLVQVGLGTLYPMVLGPLAALMFANRYVTCRMPDLKEGPKVMFNFLKGHTKPFTGSLAYIVAIQLAASSIMTYFEMKNSITIKRKLTELEQKLGEAP